MGFFGLFGNEAHASNDSGYGYGEDAMTSAYNAQLITLKAAMPSNGTLIHQDFSFMPGDTQALTKFNADAKAKGYLIQTTDHGYQPVTEPAAKAVLVQTDLQVTHGVSAEQAAQAVKAAKIGPAPVKAPVVFLKGKPAPTMEAKATGMEAKAGMKTGKG